MQPYFQEMIEQFKGYLAAGDDENVRKLQIQVLGKYNEICLNRTSLGPACVFGIDRCSVYTGSIN